DDYLKYLEKKPNPIFAPWFTFSNLSNAEFLTNTKALSNKISDNKDKSKPINPLVARMFITPPTSLNQIAARYASVFSDIDQRWSEVMAGYEARKKTATNAIPE